MKRRAMSLFLIVFAIWPLVQFALTRAYDVDPWKLMGFAMYSVPGPMKSVRVVSIASDGSYRPFDFREADENLQASLVRFRERRRASGRLESGKDLGLELLAAHPDFEGVALLVLSLNLDRETARLKPSLHTDTFWRDGRDEAFVLPQRNRAPSGEKSSN